MANNKTYDVKKTNIDPQSLFSSVMDKYIEMEGQDKWTRECLYAMQILSNNDYLLGVAKDNPQSLQYAILNQASIGLTLDPAQKLCYLVPRDKKVFLDISYIGLMKLAIADGSVTFIHAGEVRETDVFQLRGLDEQPIHQYDPFDKNRGAIRGFYVSAKTHEGLWKTDHMTLEDVYDIRARSTPYKAFLKESWKTTPWETDFLAMGIKTVIKKGHKFWPRGKTNRLATAIHVLNEHEGIDFGPHLKSVTTESDTSKLLNAEYGKKEDVAPIKNKVPLANSIYDMTKAYCEGYSDEQKLEFMKEFMRVSKFEDILKYTYEELDAIHADIKSFTEATSGTDLQEQAANGEG